MKQRFSAEQRGQRILAVARALFFKHGYAETSLNDVIRVAGGSKATIIGQFGNKAGLFAAVIEDSALTFATQLKQIAVTGDARQILHRYGAAILRFYLWRPALLAYRGIIAEGSNNPELSRAFYLRGHEHIVAPVAEQLRLWHARGQLANVDFHAEADRFTHMLRNGLYEQHLLGFRRRATRAEIERQVEGAVRVFLNGLGR